MRVVEKDSAVRGLLEDEYKRCKEVHSALAAKAAQYPKGTLHVRKKGYKGKAYTYHYLVARIEGRVVNRHVQEAEVAELKRQLELRDKCMQEMLAYKKRISYLAKLLKMPLDKGSKKS